MVTDFMEFFRIIYVLWKINENKFAIELGKIDQFWLSKLKMVWRRSLILK